ncbi:MAG: thiamine pyrophosphate-binding protein [Rhodopila sp.]|nr:thiamine pyrophosphate-binding protein [Rhodopila sp.]
MKRVADLIADRLAQSGINECFLVTGGGAMHLNDAFGCHPKIQAHYLHHEQACSMAAEGYARITGRPAILNVTSGPGAINALNGVFGAYTDSIPMIVVGGQVKRETLRATAGGFDDLRQLGDQEVDTMRMVAPITKAHWLLSDPESAFDVIDEAILAATTGRPGPVWIEVPVDVQGSRTNHDIADKAAPDGGHQARPVPQDILRSIARRLAAAKRPVILMGTGVRLSDTQDAVVAMAEAHGIPIVTAWTHDIIDSRHPLFAGRPGTIGTRAGNFVVQNSDFLLILGSRLNIRQVSYNWASFARNACKVWVDVDPAELRKPFVTPDIPVVADLRDFVPALTDQLRDEPPGRDFAAWASWCRDIRARYEPVDSDYKVRPSGINSYHLVGALSGLLRSDDIVCCGDATATIVPYQRLALGRNNRLLSNSGSASMGHDLPCAIGAAIAAPDRRVICLAGDGSVMMNLQELATVHGRRLNMRIVILNNDGYLSIKQTQRNFFGREAGASSGSGLHFPDFTRVARGFGLDCVTLDKDGDWRGQFAAFMEGDGPAICVAPLDLEQEFEPRLKSRMADGVITTPELDDMFPFLPPEELEAIRRSAVAIS